MKCLQTAGFLIPRPCRNEATGPCSLCQKPICPEHTVLLEGGGQSCTACAADRGQGPNAYQETYLDYYEYDELYAGPAIVYTTADYAVFDQPGMVAGAAEQADGS